MLCVEVDQVPSQLTLRLECKLPPSGMQTSTLRVGVCCIFQGWRKGISGWGFSQPHGGIEKTPAEPCKNGRTDRDATWDVDSGSIWGSRRQIPIREGAIWGVGAKRGHPKTRHVSAASTVLEVTQQGQKRYGANVDWGVLDGYARWRNLANTTEPSICGSDAALRQITLITCSALKSSFLHICTTQRRK